MVTLANYGFANDAESASRAKGMPGIRVIATKVPCESTVIEDIEAGIDGALNDIITALTKPLTAEEQNPRADKGEKPERIMGGLRASWTRYPADPLSLKKRLKILLQCDLDIKTGRIKPVYALERLIVNLCGLRNPSG